MNLFTKNPKPKKKKNFFLISSLESKSKKEKNFFWKRGVGGVLE